MDKTLEERYNEVSEWLADPLEFISDAMISVHNWDLQDVWSLIRDQRDKIKELEAQKDNAYWERNQLVSALSKLFPAWLERHSDEDKDWDDDWRNIVYIDIPTGQVSWHIHDSDIGNFDHLIMRPGSSWDGHSTDEKYRRLSGPNIIEAQVTEAEIEAAIDGIDAFLQEGVGSYRLVKAVLEAAARVRNS